MESNLLSSIAGKSNSRTNKDQKIKEQNIKRIIIGSDSVANQLLGLAHNMGDMKIV